MRLIITAILICFPLASHAIWRHHLQATVNKRTVVYDEDNFNMSIGTIQQGTKIIIETDIKSTVQSGLKLYQFYNPAQKKYCMIKVHDVQVNKPYAAYLKAGATITLLRVRDGLNIYHKDKSILKMKPHYQLTGIESYLYDNYLAIIGLSQGFAADLTVIDITNGSKMLTIEASKYSFPVVMGFSKDNNFMVIDHGTDQGARMLAFIEVKSGKEVYSVGVIPVYTMEWTPKGFYYEKLIGKELQGHEPIITSEPKAYFAKCFWDNGIETIAEYYVNEYHGY